MKTNIDNHWLQVKNALYPKDLQPTFEQELNLKDNWETSYLNKPNP